MLYTAYELNRRAGAPVVALSGLTARSLEALPAVWSGRRPLRGLQAACELLSHARPTHTRPAFGIDDVDVDGTTVTVAGADEWSTPFGSLLHFRKHTPVDQPLVLVVGPLSEHFTTLIRATIRTLLADHDVYVLDWHNAPLPRARAVRPRRRHRARRGRAAAPRSPRPRRGGLSAGRPGTGRGGAARR